MIRVQVQFTEDQLRRLRDEAHRHGVSVAELVRRLVSRGLTSDQENLDARYDRAMAFVGSLSDGDDAADVSVAHDDYLEEAFG